MLGLRRGCFVPTDRLEKQNSSVLATSHGEGEENSQRSSSAEVHDQSRIRVSVLGGCCLLRTGWKCKLLLHLANSCGKGQENGQVCQQKSMTNL